MDILVRTMTIADYDDVNNLWKSTPGVGMRSLDDSKQGIGRFLDRNPGTNFVAEAGDKIIGVILCGHDGRRGYIYHTAVCPDYRKRGIGRRLVEKALDALKPEGINKAALIVFKANDMGNAFWQSVGFETREDLIYRNISLNEENI